MSDSIYTQCPHCGAKTTAHKAVINCWKCCKSYLTKEIK